VRRNDPDRRYSKEESLLKSIGKMFFKRNKRKERWSYCNKERRKKLENIIPEELNSDTRRSGNNFKRIFNSQLKSRRKS